MADAKRDWNEAAAKIYDFFAHVTTHFAQHALSILKEPILAAGESAVILDNAAGTGAFSLEAAREFPHVKFLGADVSEHQLAVAKSKAIQLGLSNVEFEVMDGQALTIADGGVDAIVCQFGLMFFPDKAKGWSEMCRVLKPGGTAVIATWIQPGLLPQMQDVCAQLAGESEQANGSGFDVVTSLKDPETLRRGALAAGFTDVAVHTHDFLWKAWPKAETRRMIEAVMTMPLFMRAMPEGREAEFKDLMVQAVEALADESGMVVLDYHGVITVARK